MITEKQTAYGTGFLTLLSKDLTTEFPEMKGFSRRNLSSMGQFYRFYAQLNWQQPVAELENMDIKEANETDYWLCLLKDTDLSKKIYIKA